MNLRQPLLGHYAFVVLSRLCSCAMVTQITLKTEGPPGLPSDARLRRLIRFCATQGALVARSCFILADYSAVTLVTREFVPDARTHPARGGPRTTYQSLRPTYLPFGTVGLRNFFRKVSEA